MKQAIVELLSSKKFVAALLSVILWGVGKLGLNMTEDQLAPIVGPLWLYILGQAFADHGKERAKVEAEERAKLLK